MKKIFLIALFFISFKAFSQLPSFPNNFQVGNKAAKYSTDGTFRTTTGFTFALNYADTATANAADYISFTPGILIRVNDTLWLRNYLANKWLLVGSGGGSGTVTGASNLLTLNGSTIQFGGRLIQNTTGSGSNFSLVLDSLGTGTRFKAVPNISATTFRTINLSNSDGSDSAFISIQGRTLGVSRRQVLMGVNRGAIKAEIDIIGSNSPVINLNANSTNTVSSISIDSSRLYLQGTNVNTTHTTYGYWLPDSLLLTSGLNTTTYTSYVRLTPHQFYATSDSNITIGSKSADQYADDSLVWRSTNRTSHFFLSRGFANVYSDDSTLFDNDAGYYRFTNLTSSSDTTTYKPAGLDINGKVKRMNAWPVGSGSGGTPAGNTSDVQLNRGGVFATPASDSVNYTTANGLQLKGGLITMATSGSGTIIIKSTTGGGILFGPLAGQNLIDDVTSTDFVGIGASALANQHAGVRSNIAIGKVALANDTSGGSNVAVGANTDTRSGQFNTLIGHEINQNGTTNGNNSALGYRSQQACTTCHDNTSAGKQSLEALTTGTYNTAIGLLAGESITTGSQNILIGVGAGFQGATLDPTMSNKFSVFSSSGFSGNDLMWGEINNKRLCINCAEGTALTYTLDVRGKLAVQTSDFVASKDTVAYIDQTTGEVKRTRITGTSLTSVGSGFKVAVDNTTNIKSLLAGYSISLDSATSNSVKIAVDTSTLAPYIRSTIPGAASATWNLTGNASVTTSQFLGTTDANKIRFRTNNTERGYWDSTGGTLFIGAPTYVNNTYGLIIQSPTNNSSQAIKVYSNNLSSSAELGFGRLLFSSNADIAMSSGTLKLNSPNGTFVGGSSTPSAFLHIAAGTTSLAPEAFTTGSLLTTIAAFRKEANGQGFYASNNALNRYAEGGSIADFTTDVSNSGTSETDLYTYTTKASTLAATGEKLIANFTCISSDATASSDYKVYFGGTQIYDSGVLGTTTGTFEFKVSIIRTGSSTARATVSVFNSVTAGTSGPSSTETDLTGLTFSGTNILKITGQAGGATGGTGDLTAKMGAIFWYGASND